MAKKKSSSVVESRKRYGHYCGIAYALDVIGDRWSLLIARELLLGPRRYTDLEAGLPGIASNLLTARLRELQSAGIIVRYKLPPPAASTVYELTESGLQLKEPILALGRFGARFMGPPQLEDAVSPRWFFLGMLCAFEPGLEPGPSQRIELRLDDEVVTFTVDGLSVEARQGPCDEPTLVVAAELEVFAPLLLGQVSAAQALARGDVHTQGTPEQFTRFVDTFELTRLLPES